MAPDTKHGKYLDYSFIFIQLFYLSLLHAALSLWSEDVRVSAVRFVIALIFRHLADHVVEDPTVVEISQLNISVESHPHLKCFPCV